MKNIFAAASYTPSNSDETIGTRLKHYPEQNYHQKDLSLTMVAEVFKLSPTYLSSTFKSANGQGVLEYLNQVRIDHAKHCLPKRIFQLRKSPTGRVFPIIQAFQEYSKG